MCVGGRVGGDGRLCSASSFMDPSSTSLRGLLGEEKCEHLLLFFLCTQDSGQVRTRKGASGQRQVLEARMHTGLWEECLSALSATFKEEFKVNSCGQVPLDLVS